jgi:hypothetical protein
MAASAWEFYNAFKNALGQATVDLSGVATTFRMSLHTSASNAADVTLSAISSVTGTLTTGGYVQKTLAGVNWSVRTTTSTFAWTWNTVIWTVASDSAMANVKFAVIHMQTASTLVCFSQLSTAEFTVAAGNLYVIEPNPVCFTLN